MPPLVKTPYGIINNIALWNKNDADCLVHFHAFQGTPILTLRALCRRLTSTSKCSPRSHFVTVTWPNTEKEVKWKWSNESLLIPTPRTEKTVLQTTFPSSVPHLWCNSSLVYLCDSSSYVVLMVVVGWPAGCLPASLSRWHWQLHPHRLLSRVTGFEDFFFFFLSDVPVWH